MADNPEAQIPLWFVSHAWLEPIHLFLTCLRRHSTLRELRVPAYWVCAYANNQHALEEAISNNPRKTSFYKAMRLCRGVLLVLDTQAIGWRLLRQHFAAKVFFVFHPRWKLYCTGLRALSQATLQEWGWPPAPMAPESCPPATHLGGPRLWQRYNCPTTTTATPFTRIWCCFEESIAAWRSVCLIEHIEL